LFKMDTIGDAYIVAGLLPFEGDRSISPGSFDQESARVCRDVLDVAAAMIEALAVHRATTGQDVDGRIGVSVGTVVSGVLGRLQPRFHILGPGMRHAEMLEQTGRVGAVHVSEVFLRALCCSSLEQARTIVGVHPPKIGVQTPRLHAPIGWKIMAALPHLGVVSPKRGLFPHPHAAELISPMAASPYAFTQRLRLGNTDCRPMSAIPKSPAAPMHFSNGFSDAGSATCHDDGSMNSSPVSLSQSPLCTAQQSPHLSQPSTPEASTPLPTVAEVRATGNPRCKGIGAADTSLEASVKSPRRAARLLQFWKSGRAGEGEVSSAPERSRPSPMASLVFKGSLRFNLKEEPAAGTANICSPNPGVSPAVTPGVRNSAPFHF
jgi:hypothetical protein